MNEKRLYKSRDKKICGVCGGIAEYFDIDATVVRIVWALAAFSTGVGVAAYIIAAIIMNEYPEDEVANTSYRYTEPEPSFEPESDTIKGFKPED